MKCFTLLLLYSTLGVMTSGHILRLNCEYFGNFSVVKENVVLQGSVIATFANLTSKECEGQCILNNQCKSINIDKGNTTCELNSKLTIEMVSGDNALVPKSNWIYKTTDHNQHLIGKNCQFMKPCPMDQVCYDSCDCPGYHCVPGLQDCKALQNHAYKASGVYEIANSKFPSQWLPVFCDMVTDEGGWIVFQRRIDNSVDFYRNWNEYKQGFGLITGNYWLGLDNLHILAAPGKGAVLRVDLRHRYDSYKVYAYYSTFEIGNEADGYRLNIGGYTGNAGNSFSFHNGMQFTTKDRDNDVHGSVNCGQHHKGAWWYRTCQRCNLNGVYPTDEPLASNKYMGWRSVKNQDGNIMFSEMKIRYV